MGKQINFYMDGNTELKFKLFLKESNYIMLNKRGQVVDFFDNSIYIFLTKQDFYPTCYIKDDVIDLSKSYVIEYLRTNILKEKKRITRGRLWLDTQIKVSNEEKWKEWNKEIGVLFKWIKNNIPYQIYNNKGTYMKDYISDELFEFSKQGYRFL